MTVVAKSSFVPPSLHNLVRNTVGKEEVEREVSELTVELDEPAS